jgi:hypothetical protein
MYEYRWMFVRWVLRGIYGPYMEGVIQGELVWRDEKDMNHITPKTRETLAKMRG